MHMTSQLIRAAAVAAALASLAAAPAMAREPELPVHQKPPIVQYDNDVQVHHDPPVVHYGSGSGQLPARVDGMGRRPALKAAPVGPAVPLTQAAPSDDNAPWVIGAIGAALLISLLMVAALVRHAGRSLTHPFRGTARHV
jgi:hypothetical protein